MTAEQTEILTDAGVDLPDVMDRLCDNERIYTECLSSYLGDNTLARLNDAVAAAQWEQAFSEAHMLKGIAGNMGFATFGKAVREVVELLRAQQTEGLAAPLALANRCNNTLLRAIERYLAVTEQLQKA